MRSADSRDFHTSAFSERTQAMGLGVRVWVIREQTRSGVSESRSI